MNLIPPGCHLLERNREGTPLGQTVVTLEMSQGTGLIDPTISSHLVATQFYHAGHQAPCFRPHAACIPPNGSSHLEASMKVRAWCPRESKARTPLQHTGLH